MIIGGELTFWSPKRRLLCGSTYNDSPLNHVERAVVCTTGSGGNRESSLFACRDYVLQSMLFGKEYPHLVKISHTLSNKSTVSRQSYTQNQGIL